MKKLYKMNDFSGGLNNAADPRGLQPNEFAQLENVTPTNEGKLTMVGNKEDHVANGFTTSVPTTSETNGTGLYYFSADRQGAHNVASGATAANDGDDYLALMSSNAGGAEMFIYSYASGAVGASAVFRMGTSPALAYPSYYVADGVLRVADRKFGSRFQPRWYGYIDRVNFSTASSATQRIDTWYATAAGIKAPVTGADQPVITTSPPGEGKLSVITSSTGTGTWDGTYALSASLIYENDQESKTIVIGVANGFSAYSNEKLTLYVEVNPPVAKRITGVRIYYEKADEGMYALADVDFVQGIRKRGEGDWNSWFDAASAGRARAPAAATLEFTDPPDLEGYYEVNGYSNLSDSISFDNYGDGYKAVTMVGRRAYYGGVKKQDRYGVQKYQGDAIYKSEVNKFDVVPPENKLVVSTGDGEEIIALASVGEQLLEFKQNTMRVIDVSSDLERLVATHNYRGVDHPSAVTETEYGVAWASKFGCFLYDGKTVHNLLSKKNRRIIDEDTWDNFITIPSVGYYKKRKQLIVVNDQSGTNAYIFDFVTGAWCYAPNAFDSQKTNFVVDGSGELLYRVAPTGVYQWNSEATASKSVVVETKDFDFGDPGRDKWIYYAGIGYKNAVDIDVKYRTPGGYYSQMDADLTDQSDSIVYTELSPSAGRLADKKSIQFKFSGTATADFALYDMNLAVREKQIV